MNQTEEQFMLLVKNAIYGNKCEKEALVGADFLDILTLCQKNKTMAMVLDAIPDKNLISEDLRKKWDMNRFQVFVRQKKHFYALCKVLEGFEKEEIPYLVFKGNVIADLYPNSAYRSSSDTDILVEDKYREKADAILHGLGYEHEHQKRNVEDYFHPEHGHYIELHSSVYEDYEGEKIEKLREMELVKPESTIMYEMDGASIHTLGYTEHLIYLFFHMIKHFVLESVNIRFMTDIVLFINVHNEKIDKQRFWDNMKILGYEDFVANYLLLGERYFELRQDFREGHEAKASEEALENMLLDFIYVGDRKEERNRAYQLKAYMTPYLVGEKQLEKGNRFVRIVKYIFPSGKNLHEHYAYAKKYPVLLPIAWIHRFIRLALPNKAVQKGDYGVVQRTSVIQEKFTLLEDVGLLKNK